MAAGFFFATRHSEPHFEDENSEFRCEIKFWKTLHFYSEKLRMCSPKKQKKNDENGKNLSFAACNFIDGNFISWRFDARVSQKL